MLISVLYVGISVGIAIGWLGLQWSLYGENKVEYDRRIRGGK